MSVMIRPAAAADAATIAEFNRRLAEESENKVLDPQTLRTGVEAVLADASRGQYHVAERDSEVVGQLLITYEWSDWRNGLFWWIQSVYVVPEHRRTGVFSDLYGDIAKRAEAAPEVCGIRLYVEEHNVHARATYASLGLADTGYRVLEVDFRKG